MYMCIFSLTNAHTQFKIMAIRTVWSTFRLQNKEKEKNFLKSKENV